MGLGLVYSEGCFQSLKIKGLLDGLGLRYELLPVAFGDSRALRELVPGAVYGEAPVLLHDSRVIEDWRQILLYVDEFFGQMRLGNMPAEEKTDLFALFEELDLKAFAVMSAVRLLGVKEQSDLGRHTLQHSIAHRNLPLDSFERLDEQLKGALSHLESIRDSIVTNGYGTYLLSIFILACLNLIEHNSLDDDSRLRLQAVRQSFQQLILPQ